VNGSDVQSVVVSFGQDGFKRKYSPKYQETRSAKLDLELAINEFLYLLYHPSSGSALRNVEDSDVQKILSIWTIADRSVSLDRTRSLTGTVPRHDSRAVCPVRENGSHISRARCWQGNLLIYWDKTRSI